MERITNPVLEYSLLSKMFRAPSTIGEAISILTPKSIHIHDNINKYCYDSLVNLYYNNAEINEYSFMGALEKKYTTTQANSHFVNIISAPKIDNIIETANLILEQSMRKYIFTLSNNMQKRIATKDNPLEIITDINKTLDNLSKIATYDPVLSLTEISNHYIDSINNGINPFIHHFISTGYDSIDKLLKGGFSTGQLNIIAGRPSMGKTAIMLNLAYRMASKNIPIVLFSLETTKEEILIRIMNLAKDEPIHIDPSKAKDQIIDYLKEIQSIPLYIDDNGALDISVLRSKIYQLKRTVNFDVVFIDYLQLMQTKSFQSREREVSDLSRQLKLIAKEFNIVIIVLAQLNREVEHREKKEPMLSDLRESGSIEQDADIVMFVHRDVYYNKTADKNKSKLIVAKNRTTGRIGEVQLEFIPGIASFK